MAQLQQTTEFLSDFYPVAKKVLYALENIEKLRPEIFEKLQNSIEQSLKKFSGMKLKPKTMRSLRCHTSNLT